ncbi:PREDICTED: uncharacterized protein LOC105959844 [Erythranthe guttata]|uniref:uncharacterized protein LOC105959844 n=1 Tax=Erythranthe guttata TaxID=4155 RepID=UPI00064DB35B|nr:PREDICTED: uncharacterized protein LOC105959844 [Erythranthe guttata]|eukprot:XP_012839459.1 PREDICTED: uncharacterized protein LOC105959844 [Erythranthe guttata]
MTGSHLTCVAHAKLKVNVVFSSPKAPFPSIFPPFFSFFSFIFTATHLSFSHSLHFSLHIFFLLFLKMSCYCSRRTTMKTSWTELNPGRRYETCQKYREIGGCNYFAWVDPPMCERSRQIIPGLLRRINNNEKELKKIEEQLSKKGSREKWLWMALVVALLLVYILI